MDAGVMMHGGQPVPGFALGDPPDIRAALEYVIAGFERFSRSLTAREAAVVQLGLSVSHLEESIAHGDWTRARAHAETVARLLDQLR